MPFSSRYVRFQGGRLVFPVAVPEPPPAVANRVSQVPAEVLILRDASGLVTQTPAEILALPNIPGIVTQTPEETLLLAHRPGQVAQTPEETLLLAHRPAVATQVVCEVLLKKSRRGDFWPALQRLIAMQQKST